MVERSQQDTSPSLFELLRQDPRNQSAWTTFADRYGRLIHHWCTRWGLQQDDAEDVTQNVLLQVSRQMGRFEYDPNGSFRAWLKTVAYRAWCDFLSQRSRRNDHGSGDSAVLQMLNSVEARDGFLEQLEEEWNRELLEEAMRRVRARVRPPTWEAFRLMTQEDLSGQETATKLGMNVGTVWVAKSKVQKMLYEEIQKLDRMEGTLK
jgi:RNA polymerase sigma factor (sigma-70 family)